MNDRELFFPSENFSHYHITFFIFIIATRNGTPIYIADALFIMSV